MAPFFPSSFPGGGSNHPHSLPEEPQEQPKRDNNTKALCLQDLSPILARVSLKADPRGCRINISPVLQMGELPCWVNYPAKVSEPGFEPRCPGFCDPFYPGELRQQCERFISVPENFKLLSHLSQERRLFACQQTRNRVPERGN